VSPEEKRAAIIQTSLISQFSGPLPPPEELAKYDRILPGSADRIIRMAEQQSTHRQDLESVVIGANASNQKWGLICAFIVAMSAIWGGVWISLKGMSGAGLTAIITALAALVAVFVYGKSQQRRELQDKEEALIPKQPTQSPPDDHPATHS